MRRRNLVTFGSLHLRLAMTMSMIAILLFAASCGKKGPPTLKAYERPGAPYWETSFQREDRIVISWGYPDSLRQGLSGFRLLRSDPASG